jgi:homoserine O-acetyltransferase
VVNVAANGFPLEQGGWLPSVDVKVEAWGEGARNPVVLVCHALTGNAHVARHHESDAPGWWEFLVGAGRPLDPRRVRIFATNALGGCAGSTGPASADARGVAWGERFPTITVGDMVRAEALALDQLGVDRVDLVVGGSLGGMRALEWASAYPDRVGVVGGLGVSAGLSAMALGMNHVQLEAVRWALAHRDGEVGVGWARMVAMLTYRSPAHLDRRFGRARQPDGHTFQVASYLTHQGEKLKSRFDPVSYLRLAEAMGEYRLHAAGARPIRAKVRLLALENDWLFPPEDVRRTVAELGAAGVDARWSDLRTEVGHDAFLIEAPDLVVWFGALVDEALAAGRSDGPGTGRKGDALWN